MLIEHERTKRTVIPQLNSKGEEIQIKSGKKRPPMASVSKASGAIINLIDQTPQNTVKYKKFSEKLLQGNEIFTPSGFAKLKNKPTNRAEYIVGSNDPLNINVTEQRNKNNR